MFLKHALIGCAEGLKRRDPSLIGMIFIAAAMPLLMLSATSIGTGDPFGMELIKGVGYVFYVSVAFSLYLVIVMSVKGYYKSRGAHEQARKLTKQVDFIVVVGLFSLLIPIVVG